MKSEILRYYDKRHTKTKPNKQKILQQKKNMRKKKCVHGGSQHDHPFNLLYLFCFNPKMKINDLIFVVAI